jgi:hypothetical protein
MALSVRRAANFDAETAAATDGDLRMLTIDRTASPQLRERRQDSLELF